MGYSKRENTSIIDFWPDNTETEIYLTSPQSLSDIEDEIIKKWSEYDPNKIFITSTNIHTTCIYYDRYDSSDYTDFILITKLK